MVKPAAAKKPNIAVIMALVEPGSIYAKALVDQLAPIIFIVKNR